jgi:EmrB/QacA subfamily drug resistance transporter
VLFQCDSPSISTTPQGNQKRGSQINARMVLATTILASSLAFIDGSVVNVGLAAIGQAFAVQGSQLTWVVNGYLLPLGALLLAGGAAGDLYGKRRVLIIGLVLFAVASLLCSLAPSIGLLIAGRVLQGIGAAVLMPNSLAILAETFDGEARGRAVGIWAAVGAAMGAIAPVLGGSLIDHLGWRTIFLINLPIAIFAVLLAICFVPQSLTKHQRRLDATGAALITLCLSLLTWGLTEASAHSSSVPVIAAVLTTGLASLMLFIVVEGKLGEAAMLPGALFASRQLVGLTILTFLLYGALGGLMLVLPYDLIKLKGYSATEAGAALLPLPVIVAAASPSMGRLSVKLGARLLLTVGPLVVAVGLLLCLFIDQQASYWTTVFPAICVAAIGLSGAVAPLTTTVLSAVSSDQTGIASGLNSAVARIGGLVAIAALGALFAAQGSQLEHIFKVAVLCGAALSLLSGITAWLTVTGGTPLTPKNHPRKQR